MRLEPESEEQLRRYVLGSLEEDSRLQLEEKLIQDPDAFELLGVIEDELTEEYLDGSLTEAERLAFERHRGSSADGRRALEFLRTLKSRASAPAAEPEVASIFDRVSWLRTALRQPVWLGAAAALLVASLAGNAWFVLGPGSTAGPGAGAVVPTFTLASGSLRSTGSLARVAVPPDVDVVRLLLDLPGDEYTLYRAALHDVDGDELWAQSKIKAESTEEQIVISLLVPAPLMPHGDYQLKVSGIAEEGEPEGVASYTFRVIRP